MEAFLHLVRKHDFGPDETHEMGVAYQNVCAAVKDLTPDMREFIASQIIQLAVAGVTDSIDLYVKCLDRYCSVAHVKRAG